MQLKELAIDADTKNNLLQLPMLFGGREIIRSAMKLTKNERSIEALENIDQIYKLIKGYGLSKYTAFDLGMIQSLNYYTGIIFRGHGQGNGLSHLRREAGMIPWFLNSG